MKRTRSSQITIDCEVNTQQAKQQRGLSTKELNNCFSRKISCEVERDKTCLKTRFLRSVIACENNTPTWKRQ